MLKDFVVDCCQEVYARIKCYHVICGTVNMSCRTCVMEISFGFDNKFNFLGQEQTHRLSSYGSRNMIDLLTCFIYQNILISV